MARNPKPWWNAERKAWYVTVGGKRHRLAEDKREADRAFYSLMLAEGRVSRERGAILVADACEALMASVQHHRANTRRLYQHNLLPIAEMFGGRRLDSLTPAEVLQWIAGYTGRKHTRQKFTDAGRYILFRYVKTLYRWARDVGHIDINPFHGRECPWKAMPRTRCMTQAEFDTLMGDRFLNDRFREVIEFLWRTGARPSEIAQIQARHLDARLPIARLQPTEHKTGTKTGRQREIVMPDDLMDRLRIYAKARPRGELLRTAKGYPWTSARICQAFRKARKRLGLPADLVIYMTRHGSITRMIEAGHSPALVAKIHGHADTRVLMNTYFHADDKAMAEIVAQENAGEAERLKAIREEMRRQRKKHKSTARNFEPPSSDSST